MKYLFTIFGLIVSAPLLAVIIGLACITLIGGYVGWIVSIAWEALLAVLVGYCVIKLIKHFTDKG